MSRPDSLGGRYVQYETESAIVPNFLIIGAPRSCTSSLAAYLRSHPQVFLAREKELHFFDQHYDPGLGLVPLCLPALSSESAIGEATPAYMYDAGAMQRIAQTLPDVRSIATLRNPNRIGRIRIIGHA